MRPPKEECCWSPDYREAGLVGHIVGYVVLNFGY